MIGNPLTKTETPSESQASQNACRQVTQGPRIVPHGTALLLSFLALFLFNLPANAAAESSGRKNILLLYQEAKNIPAIVEMDQSITSTIRSRLPGAIDFYPEFLDLTRFSSDSFEQEEVKYYRMKYADKRIDLIFAVGRPVLNLLMKHRAELFPETPIVFLITDKSFAESLGATPGVTGVSRKFDFNETLEVALHLHPDTQQVTVVSGTGAFDLSVEAEARGEFRNYEERVKFTYLSGLVMSDLIKELAHQPQHTIVFYLSVLQDGIGDSYTSAEGLGLIARTANAPIYGVAGTLLGNGIVGGHILDFNLLGAEGAASGLRILQGEKAEDIPISVSPNSYTFDWRELRRWGINEDKLPAGSFVSFRELSAWELYKWRIVGIVLLSLLEAVLIAGLLIERRKRKRANMALDERLGFEMMVSELSSTFINLPVSEVDKQVQVGLRRATEFLGVDLAAFSQQFHRPSVTEGESAMDEPVRKGIPSERIWPNELTRRLRIVGGVLSNALLRKEMETELREGREALHESKEELQAILDNSAAIIYIKDIEGRYCLVNRQFEKLVQLSQEHILGKTDYDLFPKEQADSFGANDNQVLKTRGPLHFEETVPQDDGLHTYVSVKVPLTARDNTYAICGISTDITEQSLAKERIRESEQRFRLMADTTPIMVWMSGTDRLCTYFNRHWLEFTGRTMEQELGNGWAQGVHPGDLERCLQIYNDSFDRRAPFEMDYLLRRADGEYRGVLDRGAPIFSSEGAFRGYIGGCIDITERKRAEKALSESEDRYRDLVEHSRDLICTHDLDGVVLSINPHAAKNLGYDQKDIIGTNIQDILAPESGDRFDVYMTTLQRDGYSSGVMVVRTRSGENRIWEYDNSLRTQGVAVPIVRGMARDVTERKLAEEKFRLAVEALPNAMVMADDQGKIVLVNTQTERLFGYNRAELLGQPVEVLIPERYRGNHPEHRADFVAEPEARSMGAGQDLYGLRKDGSEVPIEIGLNPIRTDEGILVLSSIVDITERKRAEENLRRSEALSTSVLASLSGHVAIIDREGTIVAVNTNQSARQERPKTAVNKYTISSVRTNYVEVLRRTAKSDPTARQILDGILSVVDGIRKEFSLEYSCAMPAGVQWFEMSVQPLRRREGGAVVAHLDVTNRKLAEIEAQQHRQEIAHVTRVATIGELTASLAHELNQPLTAIRSNTQAAERFLRSDTPDLNEVREILADIVADNRRASEVISRLRALMKKSELEMMNQDLSQLLRDVVKLVHSEAVIKRVFIETDLSPDLPMINGDRVQLQQVALNLIINGLEAMKDTVVEQRRLVIRTVRDAAGVVVAVRDSGTGIAQEELARIFDPFYTTKLEGMGMGLSICRTIIEAHGGRLWAENNPDRGATFSFSLPGIREGM